MIIYLILCCILSPIYLAEGFYVTLTQNGPIVIGSTITLAAELFEDDGSRPSGSTFRYIWKDNAIPQHSHEEEGEITNSTWKITYPPKTYSPGVYEVEVAVSKKFALIPWNVASERIKIKVTVLVNGIMELFQNGSLVAGNDVTDTEEVSHKLAIAAPDMNMIRESNRTAKVFWFIDCVYMGFTKGEFVLRHNYTSVGEHGVKALLVVDPPPPMPIPNTTTTTTTTPLPTTLAGGTKLPHLHSTVDSNDVTPSNTTTTPPPPPQCPNSTFIPTDPRGTYGYFHKKVSAKSPIHGVSVTGQTWLKHGDILNLNFTCMGTPPYAYCVRILTGQYNVTGKETCSNAVTMQDCFVNVIYYFSNPQTYTILLIVGNSVSNTVTPVGINVFEVQKHAQLSVIVVPISCSVLAVILIVFGVAYYIQSRSRYMVEVADFDFSANGGLGEDETEYKTFRERLTEAVSGALTRGGGGASDFSDEGPGGVWSPSRKYGSMQ